MRTMHSPRSLLIALAVLLGGAAPRAACTAMQFEGQGYAVCEVAAGADLRLFLTAPDGQPFGTFDRVAAALAPRKLVFAINAGMYHPDRAPVGLFISDGRQAADLVTAKGPGNFGMLPNGVFCIAPGGFSVTEARAYAARPPACTHASQSGPMLVIDGALHPRFMENSPSRYRRNGVGVSADGQRAYFAISDGRVNFHSFARFFRDALGTPDALYFDGNISRLYAPDLARNDLGLPMGPIVGLVSP